MYSRNIEEDRFKYNYIAQKYPMNMGSLESQLMNSFKDMDAKEKEKGVKRNWVRSADKRTG